MLDPSYNYISSAIVDHFQSVPPLEGDRFHVQFEKKDDVEKLFIALNAKAATVLNYMGYESCVLQSSGADIIIAASHNATEHFLTNLRNRTAEQVGDFSGKALLIIHNSDLDSIVGGAESLSKDSRPLHSESLRKKLVENINSSSLQSHEKHVLETVLFEMHETTYEDVSSIFAYTPFMSILEKGKMTPANWNELSLFPDPELAHIPEIPASRERIKQNSDWYDKVQTINRYSANPKDDLEYEYSNAGADALICDDWMLNSFGKVSKWRQDKNSKTLPEYLDIKKDLFNDKYEFWDRAEGTSSAASKRRHIIIFNPDHVPEIVFTLNFNSTVKQKSIRTSSKPLISVDARSNAITVTSKECDKQCIIDQFIYEDKEVSGKYIFNILILPLSSDFLNQHKANYKINGGIRSRRIQLFYDGLMVFNDQHEAEHRFTLKADDEIILSSLEKNLVTLDESADEDKLPFTLKLNDIVIPCEVYRESTKPVRITGTRIWKWKREKSRNFQYADDNKLIFGNDAYYTHRGRTNYFLNLEKEIITQYPTDCLWEHGKSGLAPKHLSIGKGLKNAFRMLGDYYRQYDLLPSLACLTQELVALMEDYIKEYQQELNSIEEREHLSDEEHNLLKIGSIEHFDGEHQMLFTPMHPLNIAYQLEFFERTQETEVPEEVLKCLSPASLLPYINDPKDWSKKMQPIPETELPEWIVYKQCHTLNRGWHNEYVQKLITGKIEDYINHFPNLFTGSVKAPVRVNLMHMGDCTDVLKGIVLYFKRAIVSKKGDFSQINPVNICSYGDHGHSNKFEEFARYSDPQLILRDFDIDLESNRKNDANDVLKILQEKLRFYLKPISEDPAYAHISFFRFNQNAIDYTYQSMDTIKTGTSLGGVVNAVPSVFRGQKYLTGFGTKDLPSKESKLITLTKSLNALARVAFAPHPYSSNDALYATLKEKQKDQLDKIYDSSNWVTLIDPKVDLNFFKMHETAKDLVIIHYSDQYNNSSGYDAITVTRKSKHYQAILKDYLNNKNLVSKNDDELKLIDMFNAINGDWLLQLIAGKKHFPREKISILSAVKTMMAFLSHPNIVWIPLSLEEILRVSGGVGLKQSEGLFSAKNLGEKGPHCDDLLMAGFERKDDETKIHLYPVEVKIGINNPSVLEKAKKQGLHTAQTLRKFLDTCKKDFTSQFYRNFFAKLILAGAEKMELYNILPTTDWKKVISENRADMLNDNYQITWSLEKYIGQAAVLSFEKDRFKRSVENKGEVMVLELPEFDGYNNLLLDIPALFKNFKDPETSFDEKFLLQNQFISGQDSFTSEKIEDNATAERGSIYNILQTQEEQTESETHPTSNCIEVVLGSLMDTNEEIKWVPSKLTNPHMMILGGSGKGKTQTVKSVIYQLAKQGVPSVVIDFNDDFIDDDFLDKTGFSLQDASQGIEVNPFEIQIDPHTNQKVSYNTVVYSLPDTLDEIFNFGSREKRIVKSMISDLYTSAGFSRNPDSWSNPVPPFDRLADRIEIFADDEPKEADRCENILSKLSPVFDLNLFRGTEEDIFDRYFTTGAVFRLKSLAAYGTSVQSAVMQFILEKVYNRMVTLEHSQQLKFCCIVDEAHYLKMNSKIDNLAKEARKFGIGLVLATQEAKDLSLSVWANTNTSIALGLAKNDADTFVSYLGIQKASQQTISLQLQNFNPFEAIIKNDEYSPYAPVMIKPYYLMFQ